MQLKTIEERGSCAISAAGWTDTESAIKHAAEEFTQDRANIRAVLLAGIPEELDETYGDIDAYAHNDLRKAFITLIDTLLPGDVSKPTEEIPGFEGTLQALGKI